MKKIPTGFVREYENHKVINVLNEYTDDICKKAILAGIPTLKVDGSCCGVLYGELYKRFDCKKGKVPPEGAMPCCKPDPVTGHWPHWVKCDENNPADKWFIEAYNNFKKAVGNDIPDGTYEAIGPHFQGNPYRLTYDTMYTHGSIILDLKDRSYDGIKEYLTNNYIEGIVFWLDGEPVCKIKRSDFGLYFGKDRFEETEFDAYILARKQCNYLITPNRLVKDRIYWR